MQLIHVCQSLFTGTPDFVMKGLKKFGFEAFRAGQEHAVKRILAGKNLKNFLWGETTKKQNGSIV